MTVHHMSVTFIVGMKPFHLRLLINVEFMLTRNVHPNILFAVAAYSLFSTRCKVPY